MRFEIEVQKLAGRSHLKTYTYRFKQVGELFSATARRHRDKVAVQSEKSKLTYEELETKAKYMARNLYEGYGVRQGDRVLVLLSNDVEFPIVALACAYIGAIMVPVNIQLTATELHYIIGNSHPKVAILEEDQQDKVPQTSIQYKFIVGEEIIDRNEALESLLVQNMNPLERTIHINEEDPLFILYTSGTTGVPKGAVISHTNMIHSLMNYKNIFETNEQFTTLIAIPMFHVTGLVGQLFHMFYVGGTVYSMKKYRNEEYIQKILDKRINFLFNIPTIFIMLTTTELFQTNQFNFVRKVAYGGSAMYEETYEQIRRAFPNAQLHNAYGATESTSPITLIPINAPSEKAVTVGRPVPVADVLIVDSEGERVPNGVTGEIYVRGPMIIQAYWQNEEANKRSFTNGYWKSGDIAVMDDEHYITILDRRKDVIIRGGENIYSIEVEDVLKKHKSIQEVAVIGTPDKIFGEEVTAYIVINQQNSSTEQQIEEYCQRYLAKYKIPTNYVFIDELPRNAAGKILKQQLRERDDLQ